MGIFGWSYPPGCHGPPDDDIPIPPCPYCGKDEGDCQEYTKFHTPKFDKDPEYRKYQMFVGDRLWTFCSVECKEQFKRDRLKYFGLRRSFLTLPEDDPCTGKVSADEWFAPFNTVDRPFSYDGESGEDIYYFDYSDTWKKHSFSIDVGCDVGCDGKGQRWVRHNVFDGDNWEECCRWDESDGDLVDDFPAFEYHIREIWDWSYGVLGYELWQLGMVLNKPCWEYGTRDSDERDNIDPLENWYEEPKMMNGPELAAWLIKSIEENLHYLQKHNRKAVK